MSVIKRLNLSAVLFTLMVVSGKSIAAAHPTSTQVMVTVKVTVLATPCHINDDQAVSIEFGSVSADLIDGEAYAAQSLPVSVTCDSEIKGTLQYSLKGTPAAFDADALATDINGLAIRVLKPDGTVLAPESGQNVSPGETVMLKVIPEKKAGTSFFGGEFNASATLVLQEI